MGEGRILVGGQDRGSGFALAPRIVVTAGHVVDRGAAATASFVPSPGVGIAVREVVVLADLDAAVLLLSADCPASLTAGVAHDGQRWQIDARPRGNDPRLTGTVQSARRLVRNAAGDDAHLVQLQVDQRLDSYEGYSGAPVTLAADPGTAIGVLVEQVLADRAGLGGSRRASNVLYAVPVGAVVAAAGLADRVAVVADPARPTGRAGRSAARWAGLAAITGTVALVSAAAWAGLRPPAGGPVEPSAAASAHPSVRVSGSPSSPAPSTVPPGAATASPSGKGPAASPTVPVITTSGYLLGYADRSIKIPSPNYCKRAWVDLDQPVPGLVEDPTDSNGPSTDFVYDGCQPGAGLAAVAGTGIALGWFDPGTGVTPAGCADSARTRQLARPEPIASISQGSQLCAVTDQSAVAWIRVTAVGPDYTDDGGASPPKPSLTLTVTLWRRG